MEPLLVYMLLWHTTHLTQHKCTDHILAEIEIGEQYQFKFYLGVLWVDHDIVPALRVEARF
jgi:hypothetical protein